MDIGAGNCDADDRHDKARDNTGNHTSFLATIGGLGSSRDIYIVILTGTTSYLFDPRVAWAAKGTPAAKAAENA